jgi:uracil phosphoribosyltransferase
MTRGGQNSPSSEAAATGTDRRRHGVVNHVYETSRDESDDSLNFGGNGPYLRRFTFDALGSTLGEIDALVRVQRRYSSDANGNRVVGTEAFAPYPHTHRAHTEADMSALPIVHHLTHPLIQHKLTLMREKDRSASAFRRLLHEIALLMAYELTRDMPTHAVDIETPLEKTTGIQIDGKKTVLVPILRAGLGLVDGMLEVVPGARVGHIGLYRDPKTLAAVEYYFKVPEHMDERDVIVLDPMLATGHSAAAAVTRLKAVRPRSIRFACLLAAPEGLAHFHSLHPEVPVTTCAIDRELNDHGYILPGLGDAGDRIFGTK